MLLMLLQYVLKNIVNHFIFIKVLIFRTVSNGLLEREVQRLPVVGHACHAVLKTRKEVPKTHTVGIHFQTTQPRTSNLDLRWFHHKRGRTSGKHGDDEFSVVASAGRTLSFGTPMSTSGTPSRFPSSPPRETGAEFYQHRFSHLSSTVICSFAEQRTISRRDHSPEVQLPEQS